MVFLLVLVPPIGAIKGSTNRPPGFTAGKKIEFDFHHEGSELETEGICP